MKVGDVVKFVGSWGPRYSGVNPKIGIVMDVWTNGRTRQLSSADVLWDTGTLGNVQAHVLRVVNDESR